MDAQKYRKYYLSQNWGNNSFSIIKYKTANQLRNMSQEEEIYIRFSNHPLVKTGKAYWINDKELCIGYNSRDNPEIYRPIFSYKRQNLLNKVNSDMIKSKTFWNKIKLKYLLELSKIKKLPLDCSSYIVRFIY